MAAAYANPPAGQPRKRRPVASRASRCIAGWYSWRSAGCPTLPACAAGEAAQGMTRARRGQGPHGRASGNERANRRPAVGRQRASRCDRGWAIRDPCLRPAERGSRAAATVSAALHRRPPTCCRHLADRADRPGPARQFFRQDAGSTLSLSLLYVAAKVRSRQDDEAASAGWPTRYKTASLRYGGAIKTRPGRPAGIGRSPAVLRPRGVQPDESLNGPGETRLAPGCSLG